MSTSYSATVNDTSVNYPISDSTLPFAQYIEKTRAIIEERRQDLQQPIAQQIIAANSPYELMPTQPIMSGSRIKYGVLLIHGLLDSPFSFRDIGNNLQENGILCRSILLPGHGTNPADLLHVSYHDWIQAVRYGVETLKKDVEKIYLLGYSTGATLSVYQALNDSSINGIGLLAPAIKIRAPVDTVVNWQYITNWFTRNKRWLFKDEEIDYVKYHSVPFNAPVQVSKLTMAINELLQHHSFIIPLFMALSREDETISSQRAIDLFSSLGNRDSKMLLYTSRNCKYADERIETRSAAYSDLQIQHLSHVSMPFAPDNPHYGQHGDFVNASHINKENMLYGAYNHLERRMLKSFKALRVLKHSHAELTYNPDFHYMMKEITQFIIG